MVLPAPAPDAQPAPAVAPWVERIAKLLRLVERGIIVLVDRANDAQLGPLTRGLYAEHPELLVLTEAAKIAEAPMRSVVVLATRVEDAGWLNMARPIFAERELRVVLWSKAATTAELARRAPDFFDWIARRFECPGGPPAFAVAGLRAALRARAWAVDWRGKGLDEAFAVAFPRRRLVRANAALADDVLVEAAKSAGPGWIAWSNVLDERGARRVRSLAAHAGRRGRSILDNPGTDVSEAWRVSSAVADLAEGARVLEGAGAPSAGRLAALLDMEPEAIALAAELLRGGLAARELERAVVASADAGAAVGEIAGRRGEVDPVRVAAYRVPGPLLRAFAGDPRVRKASAILGGSGGPALPPLTERIALGASGTAEFGRLLFQLLITYAGPKRLIRVEAALGSNGAGIDALAPDGLPDVAGHIALCFKWGDPTDDDIARVIRRASTDKTLTHLVVITPYDSAPAAREWLHDQHRRLGLKIFHWGQTWIEQALRKCPPLLARYHPTEARAYLPGYDGTDFGTLAKRYREKVAIAHNRLKTIGIPPESRPRESRIELPLAELFIPLRLVPEKPGSMPIELASVLKSNESVVILADPGMGKSTLLAYVALVFAGGAEIHGFTPEPHLVPLHISLRDFVRRQKEQPGLSFLDYLTLDAREHHGLPELHRAFVEATLRMGEAMVLLDGLDEVGNETARHAVATSIRTFEAEYPDCRIWVTSRVYGYTENVRLPRSFTHYRIDRLDDARIDDFVGRWYRHQLATSPQEAAEQATSLRAAVRRTPSVRRLAGNPLLLTLMAFIHHGLRKLPKDRGELYEKCVEMLLKTWQEAKRGDGEEARSIEELTLNVPTQKDYLAHLAFVVQQKNEGGRDDEARGLISRREAVEALAARHFSRAQRERPALTEIEARDEMARFLNYVCDETGLVIDRGNDQLSFIHLSFQEYLAAWVFVCDDEMPHGPTFFVERLGDAAWEEVLLLRFYIVLLAGGGGERKFDEILAGVLRSLEREGTPEAWLTLVRAIRDDLELADRDRREILARAIGFWLEKPAFAGTWFEALEEVTLFAPRATGMLRTVLAEGRVYARRPVDTMALLHLETRLFGFPEDAVDALRWRSDLGEMLADLVAFVDEPAIKTLLAEKATVADWSGTLRALDGPEVYQTTVRWMAAPPASAAAEAATVVLWHKILGDFHSRATFAASRRRLDAASLFDQPGTVAYATPLSLVTLPYAALRTLRVTPPRAHCPQAGLPFCRSLAEARLHEIALNDTWTEFAEWTVSTIAAQLARFPAVLPPGPDIIGRIAADFVRTFIREFDGSFCHDFDVALASDVVPGFGLDLGSSFVDNFGQIFVREYVVHFGRTFVHAFDTSLVDRFLRDFIHGMGKDLASELAYLGGIDQQNLEAETALERAVAHEGGALRLLLDDRFDVRALWACGHAHVGTGKGAKTSQLTLQNPLALPLLLADLLSTSALHSLLGSLRHAVATYSSGNVVSGAVETWLLHNPIEVYATAFAWQEHCKPVTHITGPTGALFLAHAAYATLMTGLECNLPVVPDLSDPRVRISHILYELCNFRDDALNVQKLEAEIAAAGPDLRPMLEAAGLISPDCHVGTPPSQPAAVHATPPREPEPAPEHILFSWLHLSDIHLGHPDATRHWDQSLVLDALLRDMAAHADRHIPTPSAVFVTGDIAHSGAHAQYDRAHAWLDKLAASLDVSADYIFLVPGNHDVDRTVDHTNRNAARLLRGLRDGDDLLDDVLADPGDRELLTSRLAPYLAFASAYPSTQSPTPLAWSHTLALDATALRVRLVGLSTPLLAAGDIDHGKLRLGNAALAATLTDADRTRELVLVLTHHPLRGGWLADQRDADRWIQSRAHVHLFGHVHEADSEDARSGAGAGLIRVAAGAAYGDLPGVPASHGYSIAAVVAAPDGNLRLRIWPRRWSEQNKDFRADVHNTPDGRPYAEHPIASLRAPAAGLPAAAATP